MKIHASIEHSKIIEELISDDYPDNLEILFTDLEITDISVDDFLCMIAILPTELKHNNPELMLRAKRRVTAHWHSVQSKMLSEMTANITRLQTTHNSIEPCKCITIKDECDMCKELCEMYTRDVERCKNNKKQDKSSYGSMDKKKNNDESDEENDEEDDEEDDAENDEENDEENDGENDEEYDEEDDEYNKKKSIDKKKSNDVENDVKDDEKNNDDNNTDANLNDRIRACTRILTSLIKKYEHSEWDDMCDEYIKQIDIANFTTACDKLGLTLYIDSIFELEIKLDTPMQSSVINTANTIGSVIVNIFNNGFKPIYNGIFREYKYTSESHRASWYEKYDRAIKNGLRITNISNIEEDINDTMQQSLYKSVTTLEMNQTDNVTIPFHKYEALTSLSICFYCVNFNIDLTNNCELRKLSFTQYKYKATKKPTRQLLFPKSLYTLYGSCRYIKQKCLKKCTHIKKLVCDGNPRITTCDPFAKTLQILSARKECGITDDGLKKCVNIVRLDCSENSEITTCEPFAKSLLTLVARYGSRCGMSDDGIAKCMHIEELDCYMNDKITTCKPFAKSLRILVANNNKTMTDDGLVECKHIKELQCNYNDKITTCAPFCNSLRKLSIKRCSGMTDNSIEMCKNINTLICYNTKNISKCDPFIESLTILATDSKSLIRNTKALRRNFDISTELLVQDNYSDDYEILFTYSKRHFLHDINDIAGQLCKK